MASTRDENPEQPPRRRGAVERRIARGSAPRPPATVRAEMLRRQRGLAERVVSYLRDQNPTVGLTAGALLFVASGSALAYDLAFEQVEQVELAPVQPLAAEVKEGLPTAPGRYKVDPDTVTRDARGVYRFSWIEPGIAGAPHPATVSLLKLAPNEDEDELEVLAQGDPVLHLRETTPIGIVAETAQASTAASSSGTTSSSSGYRSGGGFIYVGSWFPYGGTSYTRTPVYRQPPAVAEGQSTSSVYRGSVESTAPRPAAQRTISVPSRADAVSGQASGTGGGTAVTSKSGLGVSKSTVSSPRSGGFSSASGGSSSSSAS
jgi:hypothetical protein